MVCTLGLKAAAYIFSYNLTDQVKRMSFYYYTLWGGAISSKYVVDSSGLDPEILEAVKRLLEQFHQGQETVSDPSNNGTPFTITFKRNIEATLFSLEASHTHRENDLDYGYRQTYRVFPGNRDREGQVGHLSGFLIASKHDRTTPPVLPCWPTSAVGSNATNPPASPPAWCMPQTGSAMVVR